MGKIVNALTISVAMACLRILRIQMIFSDESYVITLMYAIGLVCEVFWQIQYNQYVQSQYGV